MAKKLMRKVLNIVAHIDRYVYFVACACIPELQLSAVAIKRQYVYQHIELLVIRRVVRVLLSREGIVKYLLFNRHKIYDISPGQMTFLLVRV